LARSPSPGLQLIPLLRRLKEGRVRQLVGDVTAGNIAAASVHFRTEAAFQSLAAPRRQRAMQKKQGRQRSITPSDLASPDIEIGSRHPVNPTLPR
jgi:hypothetical protein